LLTGPIAPAAEIGSDEDSDLEAPPKNRIGDVPLEW
jgi:hypothetical protein